MKILKVFAIIVLFTISISAQTANAGADRSAFVNEPLSLDGTASTNAFDGYQLDGRHSIRWEFGYDNWDFWGSLTAPIAYPIAGTYIVTLTVCNSGGTCASDSATITINSHTVGTETVLTDTGNPVTNMSNLQAEVDGKTGTNNPIITLPVGFIARGILTLKHRTVTNYMTIRTANHASLPSGSAKVSISDAANMAIMEQDVSGNIIETPVTSVTPARYYSFLGIHFRKTVSTFNYSHTFVVLGLGNETLLTQLTNHIIFDRCYFDGGSTTSNTLRGILARTSDFAVVNSYFHRFKGVAMETQAVLTLMGERQAFINNFMEGASENFMSGGADPSITNHVPTDIVVRRNHMKKDLGWRSGDAAYYGVDFSVKNIFELKIANRVSVQGNLFENHWQEDQDYAIAITVRNQDGGANWSNITYLDFSHNKIHKIARGINTLAKDNLQVSGTANHLIYRHNIFSGVSFYNGIHQTFFQSSPGADRIAYFRNTTDQNGDVLAGQGRWLGLEDAINNTNCVISGNIGQGFIHHNLGNGVAALQNACSTTSFSAIKNGFYRNHSSGVPADNTSVSLIADVKFNNLATWDLSLAGDSPFLTTGFSGERSGADVGAVNNYTRGTITGVWNAIIICNWNTGVVCN